jgi:hypothetical protein
MKKLLFGSLALCVVAILLSSCSDEQGNGSTSIRELTGGSNGSGYTIEIYSSNGTVTKSPDKISYNAGDTVTLTATPANGYKFSGWGGFATGTNTTTTVIMNSNLNVIANFKSLSTPTYLLTINTTNGTVTKSPDKAAYDSGDVVVLTAHPNSGYTFAAWSGDAAGTGITISITMNRNKIINAAFQLIDSILVVDSAFYYSRTGFGMVDSVDIYYHAKLSMLPDSIALFWPGADSTGKGVVSGGQMTLAPDSQHITIVLTTPFAQGVTAATTTSTQGISYNKPNNTPGVPEPASPFAITDRVGPLIMSAQVVERLTAGTIDTLYVAFSEPVQASTLTGSALLLIKNGNPSVLSISAVSSMGNNRFKLAVTGTSAPQLGDSLRINPGGPIADALGNTANPLNRPVIITKHSVMNKISIIGIRKQYPDYFHR